MATARITQAAVLVLCDTVPCLTRWAECWKVTRRDGTVLAFTGHDAEIALAGVTYSPCGSLSASALELQSVMGALGNMELTGLLVSDLISETDLYGGLYDGAEVEVWIVPWSTGTGEVPWRLAAGKIGTVSQGDVGFTAEVLTPGARLQQHSLLSVYSPRCRFDLGDARCGFDLDSLEVSGSVTAVYTVLSATSRSRRSFIDSTRTEEIGFYNQGILTWTSGSNVGQQSEVKLFGDEEGSFLLYEPTVYRIDIGDAYTLVPGCNGTVDDHERYFPGDRAGFGGFPDVPGRDALVESPDSHA